MTRTKIHPDLNDFLITLRQSALENMFPAYLYNKIAPYRTRVGNLNTAMSFGLPMYLHASNRMPSRLLIPANKGTWE